MLLLRHRQLQALKCRTEFISLGILSSLISSTNSHAHTKPDQSIQPWNDNHSIQLSFIYLLSFSLYYYFPIKKQNRIKQQYHPHSDYIQSLKRLTLICNNMIT